MRPQNNHTDIELITQVLSGNQAAYADLVRRHQRFVFTLAMRFTRSREDAEEVAQDAFVKAYRNLHTFQRTAKFSTWLYSIVYTTSMTFLRRNKLDVRSMEDDVSGPGMESYPSDLRADLVEQKSKFGYLNEAISQLLPDDAAIITLFYKGEQSLEEIGQALGMESNTVKVKLYRARQRLKAKLEQMLKHEVKELL